MTQGAAAMSQFNERDTETAIQGSTCRDLVIVGPKPHETPHESGRPGRRPSAIFLAHLIATAKDFPQTREKRRLAPQEATRLYVDAQSRVQPKRARLASLQAI
jgi:hypothetical protein